MEDHQAPVPKCCPSHLCATNRAERRAADRQCPCRGECGTHPHYLLNR